MNKALKKLRDGPAIFKSVDMAAEVSSEASDMATMAVDKYAASANYEAACRFIKEMMDKRFGPSWHVAIGEGFGFKITHQQHQMLLQHF